MPDETTPTQEIPQAPPVENPTEPIASPEQSPNPQTAQMGVNEPLASAPAEETEIPEAEPTEATPAPVPQTPRNPIRELLAKAQFAIQTRKQKKKDKIMSLFAKRTSITNDEVEKLLHISDATATRYLSALEKENKIKQNSKTGKSVSYSKI